MICNSCKIDAAQIVYCDCFEVLCRGCFADHHCGHEHLARFASAPPMPVDVVQAINTTDLAAAAYRLRPYQQAALDAVMEALR